VALNTLGFTGGGGQGTRSSDVIAWRLGSEHHRPPENGKAEETLSRPSTATGWPGTREGVRLFAALAALHFRNLTGKGQLIDVSDAESLMRLLDYNAFHHATGNNRERVGNFDPAVFRTPTCGRRTVHSSPVSATSTGTP
jgi:hypothetical protein